MYQTTPPQRPELGAGPLNPEGNTPVPTSESSQESGAETIKTPEVSQETVGETSTEGIEQTVQTPVDSSQDSQASAPEAAIDPTVAGNIDETPATDLDKTFVKAAEGVIDQYEGKPYEEEEAHEGLQIKYLWQRFKRKLRKSEK
jgi:hypothetical protein